MGYKTKSMLHQVAETKKFSPYSSPRKVTSNYSQSSGSGSSSISGLGKLLAENLQGGKSMKGFDTRINKASEDGKLKKAARLEKKQAGFQRRQERGSARYAERKGTEPIFSTDKEDLTPDNKRFINYLDRTKLIKNREGKNLGDRKAVKALEKTGLLDLRKNRVSNEERKEQIARRVKENRLERTKPGGTTGGEKSNGPGVEINKTKDYDDKQKEKAESSGTKSEKVSSNAVTEKLDPQLNKSLFESVNQIFDDIKGTSVEDMKKSLNFYPGVSDAFGKANLRKNK